ncbi:MAG: DUF3995 domain-containing protein [Arenicella sp.]
MSIILAYLIFTVLSMVAAIHVYWAFGGCWPARNQSDLSRTVIGTEHKEMPSTSLTLLVAGMIFSAGTVPLIWTEVLIIPIDRQLQAIVIILLAAIFLLRGLVTYTPIGAKYSAVEPFMTLNRRYYSPLCLMIGVGLILIKYA